MPKAHPSRKRRGVKYAPIKTPANSKPNHPGETQRSTPGENFREILGLTDDKEGFETLKKHLRNVIEKHLDWNIRWHEQTDATWEKVESKLRDSVPSINETDERKRAARRYMATYFRNTRWNLEKQKLVEEDRENNPPPESHSGQRDSDSQPAQRVPVRKSSASVRRSKRKPASKPLKRSTSQNHGPLTNVTGMVNERAPKPSQNFLVIRDRPPSESSSLPDISQADGAIRDFLRACQPSLEHLMPVFTKSTMDIKSLSLAFQIAEQYEAMIAGRAGSRAD
jgi:hypothetical protein